MFRNEGCFGEYCTRFQDRSGEIRVLMCESAKDVIECQPSCLSTLVPLLKERLKDSQWEVRRSAVDSLCNLLNSHFESLHEDVVYPLCERVLDKRSEVRKFAITGLVNILSIHCSPYWNRGESVDPALSASMGVIAAMVVRCFACCTDDTKNRCSRLLNEILVSNCSSDESVGLGYLWFFKALQERYKILDLDEESMSDESLLAFRGYLRDGVRLRSLVRSLVREAEAGNDLEVYAWLCF